MSGGQYELKRCTEEDNEGEEWAGVKCHRPLQWHGAQRKDIVRRGIRSEASLSLALGLSDEIQSAAGGIRLDTLFVDEDSGLWMRIH